MNFKSILWIVLLAFLLIGGCSMCGSYNNTVGMEEGIKKAWSDVENQYKRRMDLIDQVVSTVKASANYERSTLEAVMQARASATQIKIDANNLSQENLAQFERAQNQLYSTMKSLFAVSEAYPNLQAVQGFRDLQAQIEGTENRIAVARQKFNEAVQTYNSYIRRFPTNLMVGMFGFTEKAYFKGEAGAEKAPDLDAKFNK